jgi:hypothetical protein
MDVNLSLAPELAIIPSSPLIKAMINKHPVPDQEDCSQYNDGNYCVGDDLPQLFAHLRNVTGDTTDEMAGRLLDNWHTALACLILGHGNWLSRPQQRLPRLRHIVLWR